MSSKVSSSGELLSRWRRIEEDEEENDDSDPSSAQRLNQLKEQWFTDAFTLLISLPIHLSRSCGRESLKKCGFVLNASVSIIRLKRCMKKEYECSSVGPLLAVLRKLDEERVTRHLQEINSKVEKGTYDHHHAEVVSVMYEVSNPVGAPPAIAQEIHWNIGDGGTAFCISGTEAEDLSRPLIHMAWNYIIA